MGLFPNATSAVGSVSQTVQYCLIPFSLSAQLLDQIVFGDDPDIPCCYPDTNIVFIIHALNM
jgi:hypothetical protein